MAFLHSSLQKCSGWGWWVSVDVLCLKFSMIAGKQVLVAARWGHKTFFNLPLEKQCLSDHVKLFSAVVCHEAAAGEASGKQLSSVSPFSTMETCSSLTVALCPPSLLSFSCRHSVDDIQSWHTQRLENVDDLLSLWCSFCTETKFVHPKMTSLQTEYVTSKQSTAAVMN